MLCLLLACVAVPAMAQSRDWQADQLFEITSAYCRDWEQGRAIVDEIAQGPVVENSIDFRGSRVGTRYRIPWTDGALLELHVVDRDGRPSRFVTSLCNRRRAIPAAADRRND